MGISVAPTVTGQRHKVRAVSAVVTAAMSIVLAAPAMAGVPPVPIPQDPNDVAVVPGFVGSPARPAKVAAATVPQHPFMAPNGRNNIHDDAYMTDTYTWRGPLGRNMQVRSTYHNAECASLTFDAENRIVTICVGVEGPRLVLIDPETLETEAVFQLPPRSVGGGTGGSFFTDFSGGGYFYLDDRDRAVIPTNNRQIWIVGEVDTPAGTQFELQTAYDLSTTVLPTESIVSALPDWDGRIWFVTTRGLVGFVDPRTEAVRSLRLEGEVIANSFAVDEAGGVFVVSDHALYRFDADSSGPTQTWRRTYDRGTRVKPGQVSQGSGTTPTLVGRNLVAITDNADPRMHVLVYRTPRRLTRPRLICSMPVFRPYKGSTDNSLIGAGRSFIVENNYGYTGPTSTTQGATTEPGITRVDLDPDGTGCEKVWTSKERVPSVVPKLSLANGLVYVYSKDPGPEEIDAWYFTAIDFRTGRTVYKRLAGTGLGYNNNYAPVSLGPDGAGYVGALGGLVQLRDRAG